MPGSDPPADTDYWWDLEHDRRFSTFKDVYPAGIRRQPQPGGQPRVRYPAQTPSQAHGWYQMASPASCLGNQIPCRQAQCCAWQQRLFIESAWPDPNLWHQRPKLLFLSRCCSRNMLSIKNSTWMSLDQIMLILLMHGAVIQLHACSCSYCMPQGLPTMITPDGQTNKPQQKAVVCR